MVSGPDGTCRRPKVGQPWPKLTEVELRRDIEYVSSDRYGRGVGWLGVTGGDF